jgi:Family of unknown function (DUF5996)
MRPLTSRSQQPGVEAAAWPRFPVAGWEQTGPTLHLWTQVVGKIRLALSPPINHYWHVPLYVDARGLTTSPIPYGAELFEIGFDLVDHRLWISTSWGPTRWLPLGPRSVADFYAEVLGALRGLGVDVRIWARPVEVADPIPFAQDHVHAAYEPAAAHAFWRALVQADRVFKQFRGRFLGKCSPVHFFWGAFDLAVTRFSGRRAPMWNGPVLNVHPHVMHESYSHEVSSAGFWPGDRDTPPVFYSYAVPEPAGYREAAVRPTVATYHAGLGEFLLPYEVVRTADRPDEALLGFLQSTYEAAADLGGWDRPLLEERPPCACDTLTAQRSGP